MKKMLVLGAGLEQTYNWILNETNSNRVFINLSELLNIESCINAMSRVCQELDISVTPDEIVRRGHEHWSSCHNFKYNTV
jgi:hypothetical protein